MYLQWASIKYGRTLDQKIAAVPHILLNQRVILSTMAKTKIISQAKHPNKMQAFVTVVQMAMEAFDDEIGSLTQDICLKAYKNLVSIIQDSPHHSLGPGTVCQHQLDP